MTDDERWQGIQAMIRATLGEPYDPAALARFLTRRFLQRVDEEFE